MNAEATPPTADELAAMLRTPLDPLLADPNRLRIMAALVGLPAEGAMRFTELTRTLGLSDGNLGTHLSVLEDAGHVECHETWRGRRRTRWFRASGTGRDAFAAHVRSLRAVISVAEGERGGATAPDQDAGGPVSPGPRTSRRSSAAP